MGFGEGFLQGLAGQASVGIQDLVEANRRKKLKEQELQNQLLREEKQYQRDILRESQKAKKKGEANLALSKVFGYEIPEGLSPEQAAEINLSDIASIQQKKGEAERKRVGAKALYNILPDEIKGKITPEQAMNLDPTLINTIYSGLSIREQRKAESEQKRLDREEQRTWQEEQRNLDRLARKENIQLAASLRQGRKDPTMYETVSEFDPQTGQEVRYKRKRGTKPQQPQQSKQSKSPIQINLPQYKPQSIF